MIMIIKYKKVAVTKASGPKA